MTNSERLRESSVMMSSAMPSEKYSCSGSPLKFANGSTAIDGLSGKGRLRLCHGPTIAQPISALSTALGLTTNASTGRAMFFRLSAPSSSNARSSRPCT